MGKGLAKNYEGDGKSQKITGFPGSSRGPHEILISWGKLKEDTRLTAYANASRLMDMSRDKRQEG